jgi:signal transduction histidine kinase
MRSVVENLDAATTHELANPLLVVIAHLELLDRTQQLDACGRMHLAAALGERGLPPMLDLEKSSQR